jgi:hypothetical protein
MDHAPATAAGRGGTGMPGEIDRVDAVLAHLEEAAHSIETAQYQLQMLFMELTKPGNLSVAEPTTGTISDLRGINQTIVSLPKPENPSAGQETNV